MVEPATSFPPYLFKYRPLRAQSPTDLQYLFDFLDGRFWGAARSSFNDPFDTFPIVKARPEKGAGEAHIKRIIDESARPRHERRLWQKSAKIRVRRRGFQALAQSSVDGTLDEAGIVSLSARDDSLLMWGHYASDHTGVCVKIAVNTGISNFEELAPFQVGYSEQRPVLWYPPDDKEALPMTFLTKAKCWEYEEEWRIIKRGKPGVIQYPRWLITGVIFGARTREADKEAIRERLKARSTVSFTQASLDPEDYRVNIDPA